MSYHKKGRKSSRSQTTDPYYNSEEQRPNVPRQYSMDSTGYYNENSMQQIPNDSLQRVSYVGNHPSARDSGQEYSYPYAAPDYTSQYRGSQSDYRNYQDNYRGGYGTPQDNYRESQDLREYSVGQQYQNSPQDLREYSVDQQYPSSPQDLRASEAYKNFPQSLYPNNPSAPRQSYPSGEGQFDVYSDFNNANPQTHDADEYDDSGTLTPTLQNVDSANGNPTENVSSDQFTQGLISEKEHRSPRCCCCSRKMCVIITFIILIILGIVGFFIWPRIPNVSVLENQATADAPPSISLANKTLKFNLRLPVKIQNPDNWIPIRFNEIDAQVFDQNTIATYNRPIATGNVTNFVLPPRTASTILWFPLGIDYIGNSTADPVIMDFQSACTPPSSGAQATTLNIRADITLSVWGISWIYKPHISVGVSNFVCPYNQIASLINQTNITSLLNS